MAMMREHSNVYDLLFSCVLILCCVVGGRGKAPQRFFLCPGPRCAVGSVRRVSLLVLEGVRSFSWSNFFFFVFSVSCMKGVV